VTTTYHLARKRQGALYFEDRPGYERQLLDIPEGHLVEVILRSLRRQRSLNQNRYYFGCVLALIAAEHGIDFDSKAEREAMHDAVAFKFLRISDCPLTGSPRRLRTPDFDTAEFSRYVERVRRWAAEDGIVIPDPHRVPDESLAPWRGEVAA
jgi:hypothetical protein